jgi:riboflavin kinase/FMN adenylyltransferase
VTNVGNKPTIGNYGKNAETHIFDFEGNLYGADIKVEFVDFVRPEYTFESIDALERQIAKDCEVAKSYFDNSQEAFQS